MHSDPAKSDVCAASDVVHRDRADEVEVYFDPCFSGFFVLVEN